METEQRIADAKKVLRSFLGDFGKPRTRMHAGAAEDNTNRLKALKGICGQCASLTLEFERQHGKNTVAVGCREKLSPLDLYRNTFGEEPSCPGFKERMLK